MPDTGNSSQPMDKPAQERSSPLADLNFLLGTWRAIHQPGEPAGGFSFELSLLGRVILRTNYADYPVSQERPAFRHEDLMMVYVDEDQALRADYYDSEGHVIRYVGQTGAVGEVTFTSSATTTGPGFRLTYHLAGTGTLEGKFEINPPGGSGEFMPYLSWTARRVSQERDRQAR